MFSSYSILIFFFKICQCVDEAHSESVPVRPLVDFIFPQLITQREVKV